MILIYLSLLLFLGLLRLLIAVRVRLLERKIARAAADAQALLQQPAYREGNSRHADPYKSAKQQFVLGSLVQKRDRAEGRYAAWQARSEKLGQVVRSVRAWKGRLVPYLFGVVDVVLLLGVLSALGLADPFHLSKVLERVSALLARLTDPRRPGATRETPRGRRPTRPPAGAAASLSRWRPRRERQSATTTAGGHHPLPLR